MRFILFCLISIFLSFPLFSSGIVYQCTLEKIWVRPGGQIPFRVEILMPEKTVFVSATTNFSHPDIEVGINNPEKSVTGDGRKKTVVTGSLQIFSITNIRFEGLQITLSNGNRRIRRVVGKAGITVVPPPINTKKKPLILPLKGPLEYPTDYTLFLLLLFTAAAAGAGFYLYLKARKRRAPVVLPGMDDVVDPWDLVQRRLAMLQDAELDEEQKICDFYFQLTETVRMYLTGRSRLPFEETTTTELESMLEQVDWVSRDAAVTIEQLFQNADLVKFARFIPEEEAVRNFYKNISLWLSDMDAEFRRFSAILKSGGNGEGTHV